uniref:hypothetical protein n=1 Tax=Nocardioides stalactiti TaxID=2755356 RepID=UPI001C8133EA
EIIELGERLVRPEVALLGYEWKFGERLGQADIEAAEVALRRLELYAHLTPSPHWRFAAGLRRACMLCLQDDREGALQLLTDAVRAAEGWLHPGEIYGIELGFRSFTAFLYGVPDPAMPESYLRNVAIVGDLTAPFLHAGLALAAWVLGDQEAARGHLSRASLGIETVAVGLESLFALNVCGLAAAQIGDVRMARTIRPLLEPYAGRLTASGSIVVPVATTLGLISDLLGDRGAAQRDHQRGLAVAERAGSAVMVERCRALAGAAPSVERTSGHATITRSDDGWTLASPFGVATLEESLGLRQLIAVLGANGREVAALDLAGTGAGPVAVQSDLGPALDAQAKRAYRARIADLREEIDDAEDMNDPDRASRARWELDTLLEELGRAVGLAGRDRPQGATDERARVNVTRSVKRAITAVGALAPELGAHLEASVRTGRQCRYQPDPAVGLTWEFTSA